MFDASMSDLIVCVMHMYTLVVVHDYCPVLLFVGPHAWAGR